ncbi:MAG: histidine kinase [Saprospiraceae bacterium]|nr:histidine kinase [Saprospiraceae bacterium]
MSSFAAPSSFEAPVFQLSERKLLWAQVIFWIASYVFSTLFEAAFVPFYKALIGSTASTIFYLIVFYIHSIFIFPLLIPQRSYVLYFIIVIFFVFITSLIYIKFSMWNYPQSGEAWYDIRWGGLLYNCFLALTTMAISAPVKFTYDYFKMVTRQQQIVTDQLQTELKYLKMQINPHFLFNTLNNLLYLTQEKSEKAPEVVERLADMMRYLLEKSNEEQVLLTSEIEFLKAYIELEKIRVPHIIIKMNTQGNLSDKLIPPLTFLPLVENAFKHGVDKRKRDNYVYVNIISKKQNVICNIENRMRPERDVTKSGIGLDNLLKRMQLIYGDRFEFDKTMNEQYYSIRLKIPYL